MKTTASQILSKILSMVPLDSRSQNLEPRAPTWPPTKLNDKHESQKILILLVELYPSVPTVTLAQFLPLTHAVNAWRDGLAINARISGTELKTDLGTDAVRQRTQSKSFWGNVLCLKRASNLRWVWVRLWLDFNHNWVRLSSHLGQTLAIIITVVVIVTTTTRIYIYIYIYIYMFIYV